MNSKLQPKAFLPTLPLSSYQGFAFVAVFLTGFCALCSQVIWQKYLAILTGSEARSLSLVVAIFLLGLASGYYVFGLLTENKNRPRFLLLKYYGYVELLTGLYIGLFPHYFPLLKNLSFNTPSLLIIDIIISLLALFLPTFLMGASIPMLTATLPHSAKQVNQIHSKVYGWNTLGACLGALISGFYLIPKFGLPFSLIGIAFLNVIASLVFIGNKLEGDIVKKEKPQSLDSPFPNKLLFVFVFIAGSLTVSFEILFIRILNLSIGAGAYNFPIILSLFIGALACGSLSLGKKKVNVSFFIHQLFLILVFLLINFITAPYWSSWLNHVRVSLTTLPSNYIVWFVLIFLFLTLFIFPPVFLMGRLLPLSYMFLKKTEKNYGKVCGFLYFSNTLGTVFGAVVMGYLAFYVFDLDIIFKLNLYLFLLLTVVLVFIQKNKLNFFILSFITLLFLLQPSQWDRGGHEEGLFRHFIFNPHFHFRSLFSFPTLKQREVAFFKDGPNSTVSLLKYSFKPSEQNKQISKQLKELFSIESDSLFTYSILVNGKSDGNTLGDFSTTFFMLPYLYSTNKTDLKTAFIGLGTGVSAGAYTSLEDVTSIDVLEISPFVIQAVSKIEPAFNFNVLTHEKVNIIENDAFKYFTKSKKKYDIIVSEPSNPWVMGVENLYTMEFYQLIKDNLSHNGIFAQWLHSYSLNYSILEIVSKTLFQVFPHATLYRVGAGDILFVASPSPLKELSQEKFSQAFVKKFYSALGAYQVEDLYLSQLLNQEEFKQLAFLSQEPSNSLYFPKIIYRANKAFFLNSSVNMFGIAYKPHFLNPNKTHSNKMKAFDRLKTEDWKTRCLALNGFNFLCRMTFDFINAYNQLKKNKNYIQKFDAYLNLRRKGLIPYSQQAVSKFIDKNIQNKKTDPQLLFAIHELLYNEDYQFLQTSIEALKNAKLINEEQEKNLKTNINFAIDSHKKLKQQGF